MLSPVRPSVCPSVCPFVMRVDQSKQLKLGSCNFYIHTYIFICFQVTSTHRKSNEENNKEKTKSLKLHVETHENKHNAYEQPTDYSAQSIVYKNNAH